VQDRPPASHRSRDSYYCQVELLCPHVVVGTTGTEVLLCAPPDFGCLSVCRGLLTCGARGRGGMQKHARAKGSAGLRRRCHPRGCTPVLRGGNRR